MRIEGYRRNKQVVLGIFMVSSGSGALSPGLKWLGPEADYSPPHSAEVKNVWSYISTAPIRFHCVVLN
jgi:hypothetical protein